MGSQAWLGIELDPRWYDAIPVRVSRRAFDGRTVAGPEWNRLLEVARRLTDDSDVNVTLAGQGAEKLFIGVGGGYGRIVGSPCAALFSAADGHDLEIGYIGEALVLEATALGLNTCWVAGNFSRKIGLRMASLAEGDRVYAATPIGYAVDRMKAGEQAVTKVMVRARTRLPTEQIAPGASDWPAWAQSAVEAARLAPSGGNKQSWRFALEDDQLLISEVPARFYWTHTVDCGIAMLHAKLGALAAGVGGDWRSRAQGQNSGSELARFTVR